MREVARRACVALDSIVWAQRRILEVSGCSMRCVVHCQCHCSFPGSHWARPGKLVCGCGHGANVTDRN
eukprot:10021834-Alexandrium_andersonii.AAC.1